MLKQEEKENRNIYLCKLVLIQLGRDPTAFKVWVTNHYDQKCWCARNTQGLFLVTTAQACCRAKVELTNIKYSFEPPFIRWYFGKGRTRWPAMSPGLYILLPLYSQTDPHSGKSEGGHITFPDMRKLCSFPDDPKCSNYWLFPLVGDAASRHIECSEPARAQLLSLTCGQSKNWNWIYPDKCKGFCLKQLFSKLDKQLWNGEEMNSFLERLNQSEVNVLKTRC